MCPCTRVRASLGVTLRGRGLPVPGYLPVPSFGHWYPVELSIVVGMVHSINHHHATTLLLAVVKRKRGSLWRREIARHCVRAGLVHPSEALLESPFYRCRKLRFRRIENPTKVGHQPMSGTEEVQSWAN